MVLIAHPSFAPATVAELIAEIKAHPGRVTCGASGALPSVGCELLRAHAGADLLMVMYKGNAPALNALMAGEINLLFDVVNIAAGHVKSGRVKAIATTAPRRGSGPLGELPLMAETIPGFELVTWHGVMAAPATPRPLVERINRELNAVLMRADVRCAVLYEKPRSLVKCEYVWKRTAHWVNFPWSSQAPVVTHLPGRALSPTPISSDR